VAIAFVAERYKNAAAVQPGNGVTNTLGVSGISVGNHLIILVSLRGGAAGAVITPVSASDNAGNTYTLDVSLPSTSSTMGVALLSAHMGAAPTQVTLTFNNAGASAVTCAFKVEEFSGLASTGYFDVGASSTPAATLTPTWPTITPAAAGELIFAGLAGGGNAQSSFTPGGSYVQAGTPRNAAPEIIGQYLLSCPSGAQNATGTCATTTSPALAIGAYKPPSGNVYSKSGAASEGTVVSTSKEVDKSPSAVAGTEVGASKEVDKSPWAWAGTAVQASKEVDKTSGASAGTLVSAVREVDRSRSGSAFAGTSATGVKGGVLGKSGAASAGTLVSAVREVDRAKAGVATSGTLVSALREVDRAKAGAAFAGTSAVGVAVKPVKDYPSTVLADTPVGYWKLDDMDSTCRDSSGNGLDGTYTATGITEGQPGIGSTSCQFDGASTTYANVPHNALLNIGDVFTLEAWVKLPASPNANTKTIVSKGDANYQLKVAGSGDGRLFLTKQWVSEEVATAHAVPVDGNWHHVVCTKNGAAIHLYVDGVDDTGPIASSAAMVDNTTPLQIGTNTHDHSNSWQGWLDEVAVYGHVLTAAQVTAHYNAGVAAGMIWVKSGSAFAGTSVVGVETKTLGRTGVPVAGTLVSAVREVDRSRSGTALTGTNVFAAREVDRAKTGTATGGTLVSAVREVDRFRSGAAFAGTYASGVAIHVTPSGTVYTKAGSVFAGTELSGVRVGTFNRAGAAVMGTAAGATYTHTVPGALTPRTLTLLGVGG